MDLLGSISLNNIPESVVFVHPKTKRKMIAFPIDDADVFRVDDEKGYVNANLRIGELPDQLKLTLKNDFSASIQFQKERAEIEKAKPKGERIYEVCRFGLFKKFEFNSVSEVPAQVMNDTETAEFADDLPF